MGVALLAWRTSGSNRKRQWHWECERAEETALAAGNIAAVSTATSLANYFFDDSE